MKILKQNIRDLLKKLNSDNEGHLFIESKMNNTFYDKIPTKKEIEEEGIYAEYKFTEYIKEQIRK